MSVMTHAVDQSVSVSLSGEGDAWIRDTVNKEYDEGKQRGVGEEKEWVTLSISYQSWT